MIFANIIVGTLDTHADLVTQVVLVLSITMRFFVLPLKVSSLKCTQAQQGRHFPTTSLQQSGSQSRRSLDQRSGNEWLWKDPI